MPTYIQLGSEVWWSREYQPPSLAELCERLRQHFGVDANALGSKGDNNHLYGYHRSRAWIVNSAWSADGWGDYSVQAEADRGGDDDWLCAVDFTPGDADTMITVCQRLDAAARAGLCPQLREWYGNVDGDQYVDGWDLLTDRAASSDSSHLWHLHMSFLRSRADDDHGNLFAILTGTQKAPPKEDDVQRYMIARDDHTGQLYLCDGMKSRPITDTDVAHIKTLAAEGLFELVNGGATRDSWYPGAFGPVPTTGGDSGAGVPVDLSDKALADVSHVVDKQLDQQSLGGADNDSGA